MIIEYSNMLLCLGTHSSQSGTADSEYALCYGGWHHSDTGVFDDWNNVSLRQNCNTCVTVSHVNAGFPQTVHTPAIEYVIIEVMNESDWEAHAIMHENFGYPNWWSSECFITVYCIRTTTHVVHTFVSRWSSWMQFCDFYISYFVWKANTIHIYIRPPRLPSRMPFFPHC